MAAGPLVSVVTPSYNFAPFIGQGIESVLSQDYPRIDYLVMDGGSTDGTLEILRRYEGRLRYVSVADRGAADAINQGFGRCEGTIFAWLNADDFYLPGAVSAAVRAFLENPDADVAYGEAVWCDAAGRFVRSYPVRHPTREALHQDCCVCQPACFVRRSAFEKSGGLDATLECAFDHDFWIRLARDRTFVRVDKQLAASRMHPGSKTLRDRRLVYREAFRVYQRHYGHIPFPWIHGYCCNLVDGRDQFYECPNPTLFKYLLSLPVGCWYDRRSMGRFLGEWSAVMNRGAFARWLSRTWPQNAAKAGSDRRWEARPLPSEVDRARGRD
jgi:glycosyltransferase involved in cell wall biosynthesis